MGWDDDGFCEIVESEFITPVSLIGFGAPPTPPVSVTFNNTNTIHQVSTSTYSAPASVTAGGSNVVAFAVVAYDGTLGGISVTASYGGNAMTSCGAPSVSSTGSHTNVAAFYLASPPTGSNTLAITGSGTGFFEIYVNLIAFAGVNQTTPVRPGTYQTLDIVGATSGTLTITSDPNDMTLSAAESGNSGSTNTTNQTSDGINNNGGNGAGSDHCTTPASSVVHTWTFSSTQNVMLGFSIQHA